MSHDEASRADADDASVIILQNLICLLREKNVLSRADVQELCQRVEQRAHPADPKQLPCCPEAARTASSLMHRLTTYIGQRYGGKHGSTTRMRS